MGHKSSELLNSKYKSLHKNIFIKICKLKYDTVLVYFKNLNNILLLNCGIYHLVKK